jgi:hypothetical protein
MDTTEITAEEAATVYRARPRITTDQARAIVEAVSRDGIIHPGRNLATAQALARHGFAEPTGGQARRGRALGGSVRVPEYRLTRAGHAWLAGARSVGAKRWADVVGPEHGGPCLLNYGHDGDCDPT